MAASSRSSPSMTSPCCTPTFRAPRSTPRGRRSRSATTQSRSSAARPTARGSSSLAIPMAAASERAKHCNFVAHYGGGRRLQLIDDKVRELAEGQRIPTHERFGVGLGILGAGRQRPLDGWRPIVVISATDNERGQEQRRDDGRPNTCAARYRRANHALTPPVSTGPTARELVRRAAPPSAWRS